MRAWGTIGKLWSFGPILTATLLLIATPMLSSSALAKKTQPQRGRTATQQTTVARTATPARPSAARAARPGVKQTQYAKTAKLPAAGTRMARRGGGLQCVPFARNAAGIALSGNAWQWWDNAAGQYARGNAPEDGAILSFRSNGSMKLGHVAVVSRVVNARQIEIDHANWAGPGGRKGVVTRGAAVVDVSDNNDWTAVRVTLGRSGDFGSIYPTNGFIYDRAERDGVAMAARTSAAPAPMAALELNTAPRDLRPVNEQPLNDGYLNVSYANGFVEVAEAPAASAPRPAGRARKPSRIRR